MTAKVVMPPGLVCLRRCRAGNSLTLGDNARVNRPQNVVCSREKVVTLRYRFATHLRSGIAAYSPVVS